MRTIIEDQLAHCPKCGRKYSVALVDNGRKTYFDCMWIDCSFEMDAPMNGVPTLEALYNMYFNAKGEWHGTGI